MSICRKLGSLCDGPERWWNPQELGPVVGEEVTLRHPQRGKFLSGGGSLISKELMDSLKGGLLESAVVGYP